MAVLSARETLDLAMSERAFQQLVTNAARMHGYITYHTWRSDRSEPGFPDVVAIRGVRCIFAELKGQRGRLSPAQKVWIEALKEAGQEVYLWRPSDWQDILDILQATGRPS